MTTNHPELTDQTIALTDTCLEGLTHMQSQLEQGLHEASLRLYCNVLEAVVQVEASVNLVLKEEEEEGQLDRWAEVRDQLNARLAEMADSFQAYRWNDILPQLQRVLPEFKIWQQTVYEYMSPKFLV
ncbi:hypothetical protein [Paenibacillus koleovorans]|uniref:hypothetical protein n=1 Tax=Paenibacillus koleovorans TaxID=121608 RepID=UPI000FD9E2E4|nr:hypothetical protein [Paenibacillus koleovorans]